MTDAAWETLSNQAVAAAGVVYFLALLAHLVEWAAAAPGAGEPAARRGRPARGRRRRRGRRRPVRASTPTPAATATCSAGSASCSP